MGNIEAKISGSIGGSMKIAVIGQIEDDHIISEINKQNVQPDLRLLYTDPSPAQGIDERRKRIAENHKKLVDMARKENFDYVWQIEGDGVYESDTLSRLITTYVNMHDSKCAYISGIQVGRHGIYSLGAWHIADTRQSFRSLDYKARGLQKVDATGFYCLFAPKDIWLQGTASWNGERWGPDVNWSLSLREMGYNIYVNMNIKVGHKTQRGIIHPEHLSTCNVKFYKNDDEWVYKTYV